MKLSVKVFCLTLLAVALLAGSATSLASQSTSIGKGTKQCVLGPGADCRGVVERWTVEHHGDLRKAKFTGAVLHGADFRGADLRGADLRGADFRGAKLRHANLRGANLKGARFDPVKRPGNNARQACTIVNLDMGLNPNCQGADLSYSDMLGVDAWGVNLTNSNLTAANLVNTNLTNSNLTGANLFGANLFTANLTNVNLTGATLVDANPALATLINANLTNANVNAMNLNADFTGATGCSTVTPSGALNGLGCAN
jgi:uncharacterized protein YjbI with pentapeptide repeats